MNIKKPFNKYKFKLSFLGGAREVGRSCFFLNYRSTNIILDIGAIKNFRKFHCLPSLSSKLNKNKSYTVFISHFHFDHTGSLPVLINYTRGTFCIIAKMLTKSLYYRNLEDFLSMDSGTLTLFEDIEISMEFFENIYNQKTIKNLDLKISFINSGHVFGSSMINMTNNEIKLIYTGDYDNSQSLFYPSYNFKIQKTNFLLIECTLGILNFVMKKAKERVFTAKIKNLVCVWDKFLILIDTFSNFAVTVFMIIKILFIKKIKSIKVLILNKPTQESINIFYKMVNYLTFSIKKVCCVYLKNMQILNYPTSFIFCKQHKYVCLFSQNVLINYKKLNMDVFLNLKNTIIFTIEPFFDPLLINQMFQFFNKLQTNQKLSSKNIKLKLIKILNYTHPPFLMFLETSLLLRPNVLFVIHCSFHKGLSVLRKFEKYKRKYNLLNIILLPQFTQRYKTFTIEAFHTFLIYFIFCIRKNLKNKTEFIFLKNLKVDFYQQYTLKILKLYYMVLSLSGYFGILFFRIKSIIWIKSQSNILFNILSKILSNLVFLLSLLILK